MHTTLLANELLLCSTSYRFLSMVSHVDAFRYYAVICGGLSSRQTRQISSRKSKESRPQINYRSFSLLWKHFKNSFRAAYKTGTDKFVILCIECCRYFFSLWDGVHASSGSAQDPYLIPHWIHRDNPSVFSAATGVSVDVFYYWSKVESRNLIDRWRKSETREDRNRYIVETGKYEMLPAIIDKTK